MREVEVSQFVAATLPQLDRHLSPATVLGYEGTFAVEAVTETDDGWLVTASAGGMDAAFTFEALEHGYGYRQRGEQGPFEVMETRLTYEREREGSIVTARSTVSLGLPVPALTDRVAAWKRRGELERALSALADDVA
ncbi:MAG: SRPBCC family protein [Haloarculaceae archaeon]